jgi:hypothetical protein
MGEIARKYLLWPGRRVMAETWCRRRRQVFDEMAVPLPTWRLKSGVCLRRLGRRHCRKQHDQAL